MHSGGGGKASSPCAVEAELQKVGSSEGQRVGCLQEQAAHNSDYLNKNEETPSTYGRGLEFQHDEGVLEIQGEGATYNQRLLSQSKLVKILLTYLPTYLLTPAKNLVPYYLSALVPSKKIAFTLAEVLITLGIIGVVAAMTLPAIINNTRNKELESQLKLAYSTLQGGISRMNADKGITVTPKDFVGKTVNPDDVSGSDSNTSGIFYDEYKKYFTKIYDCGIFNPDEKICMSRANSHGADSGYNDTTYKTFTGNTLDSTVFDDGQFVLSNGMLVIIENSGGANCNVFISVDINGKKKKPNRLGQDLFTFQLMNDGKLLPMGASGTVYPEETYCSKSSTYQRNGIACTNKALTEKDFFQNMPK